MQALRRFGSVAALAARVSSQPEAEPARAPSEARRSNCRRVTRCTDEDTRSMAGLPDLQCVRRRGTFPIASVIGAKLGPVEEGPEHVRQGSGTVGLGLAAVDVLDGERTLFRP